LYSFVGSNSKLAFNPVKHPNEDADEILGNLRETALSRGTRRMGSVNVGLADSAAKKGDSLTKAQALTTPASNVQIIEHVIPIQVQSVQSELESSIIFLTGKPKYAADLIDAEDELAAVFRAKRLKRKKEAEESED
jgi:hypothetical protein